MAAGTNHSLGLDTDGTVLAWGRNDYGQSDVPVFSGDILTVGAGGIHNLALMRTLPTAAQEPETGPSLEVLKILYLAPNPFHPSTEIAFEIRNPGPVILEIFDVAGKRIESLPLGTLESGLHRARWDGTDRKGTRVPSGVYFIRIRGQGALSRAVNSILIR